MSYDILRIVMIGFAKFDGIGNHIITLAVQAHNGERNEPYNSKLKRIEKERIFRFFRFILSFYL